jgi:hypothetical protein
MQEQALIRIALALTIPAVQELIRVALCESLSLRSLLLDLKSLKYCCLDLRCRQHFSLFVSDTILVLVRTTLTLSLSLRLSQSLVCRQRHLPVGHIARRV